MTSENLVRRVFQILHTEGASTLTKKIAIYALRQSKFDTKLRHYKYQLKYGSCSPDPYTLIRVNPNDINHFLLNRPNRNTRGTYIIDGEWDRNFVEPEKLYPLYSNLQSANKYKDQFDTSIICPFENYEHWSSFVDHFQHDNPWDCTEFYQRLMNSPEVNHPRYGHNKHDIMESLEYIDELYESILNEGYRTIRDILQEQNKIRVDGRKDKTIEDYNKRQTVKDEVRIYIGRDGKMIHDCHKGTHRLTLAKVIGVNKIPVRVIARHQDWQKIRTQIFRIEDISCLPPQLKSHVNHPDIKKILDKNDNK